MVQAVEPGSDRIEVAEATRFRIGMRIRIGPKEGPCEEREIIGFGSLVLNSPLRAAYPAGSPVEQVGDPIFVTSMPGDSDGDYVEGDESDGYASAGGKSSDYKHHVGKLELPWPPKRRENIMRYHYQFVERILGVFPLANNDPKIYYDEVLAFKRRNGHYDDPRFDVVPKKFIFLDRVVLPILEKTLKGNDNLIQLVHQRRTILNSVNKMLTSRRVMAIIYTDLAIDDSVMSSRSATSFQVCPL